MLTLQEKFFRTLSERVSASHAAEVVLEANAANCGMAHVICKDVFTPLVSFEYHFQKGHNTFSVKCSPKDQFFVVTRPEEIESVFKALSACITTRHYVRCHCCGAAFYSNKPQDPERDNGFGTCLDCVDRVAMSWVKHGFPGERPITMTQALDRLNTYA